MVNEGGRPRSESIDSAVLSAATELLLAVGYSGLTVAAVAERAGTSRPSVYRRWPTKAHLAHAAAFQAAEADARPSSGSLAEDIRELVRRTADMLTTPLARVVVPGVIAEAAQDAELNRRLLDRFAATGWSGLEQSLAAAVDRGELDPGVDVVSVVEIVIGSALAATLIRGPDCLDDVWVTSVSDVVLNGIQVPSASSAPRN